MKTMTEQFKDILEKENFTIKEIAAKLKTEPRYIERKLAHGKDVHMKWILELLMLIGYRVKMVPRDAAKDTVVLDTDDNAPLKVLHRIMLFVNQADIAQALGITRQALNQTLKKNSDIMTVRFAQLTDLLGYDVVIEKHGIELVK